MNKLIVANYKMNGDKKFFHLVNKTIKHIKIKDTEIILCPPFVYLSQLKINNKNVSLGSQDISNKQNKKCTGQISASMLKEFGAKYAIVGHSERIYFLRKYDFINIAKGDTSTIHFSRIVIGRDSSYGVL